MNATGKTPPCPHAAVAGMPIGSSPRRAPGFTLIELMVTVAIVAILAAIAIPSYQEQVRKSRRGQVQADLVELTQRAERHHTVNNTYSTFWDTVPASHRVSPRDGGSSFYNITFASAGANDYVLTATPISGTAQAQDRCGIMTINQAGAKTHSIGIDTECKFGTVP